MQSKGGKSARIRPMQKPHPPLWFGGSSPAAHDAQRASIIDTYLTWGEPPAAVAEKIADIRARAAANGRTIRFGIRLHVIVRETEEEAWAAADKLINKLDDETIARAGVVLEDGLEGQRRMAPLHGGKRGGRAEHGVYPNLWAGVGLVRGSAGTALVGNPQQVAALMKEYAGLGIETFHSVGLSASWRKSYRLPSSWFRCARPPRSKTSKRAAFRAVRRARRQQLSAEGG